MLGFPKYTMEPAALAARPRRRVTVGLLARAIVPIVLLFAASCILVLTLARSLPLEDELPAEAVLSLRVSVARIDGVLPPAGDAAGLATETDAELFSSLDESVQATIAARTSALLARGSMLRLPRGLSEAKEMQAVLREMQAVAPGRTMSFFVSFYMVMQSFMIPGVLFLNPIAGSLLPFWSAFSLVQFCSTLGSCVAYGLAMWLLVDVASIAWAAKLSKFKASVLRNRSDLVNYIVAIRLSPVAPNFFINLACPVVG